MQTALQETQNAIVIDNSIADIKFEKYELVFLDPPYKENKVRSLLDIIKNKKILKENGIILIHRDKKDLDQFPNNFKILITKNYGRSKIIFGKFD